MEALIEAFLILAREGDTGLPERTSGSRKSCARKSRRPPLISGKPVELRLVHEAGLELHAPPRVFSVLFGNLLRNACHYTDQGTDRRSPSGEQRGHRRHRRRHDAEELARVFEPFFRARRPARRARASACPSCAGCRSATAGRSGSKASPAGAQPLPSVSLQWPESTLGSRPPTAAVARWPGLQPGPFH